MRGKPKRKLELCSDKYSTQTTAPQRFDERKLKDSDDNAARPKAVVKTGQQVPINVLVLAEFSGELNLTESHLKPKSRLSNIDTSWNLVRRSHESKVDGAVEAQQRLLHLYGSAIKRYLIASIQDVEVAEDLFQEFALRFVEGKLRNADPSKGRFRNYVKTVLRRLIADHFRSRSARQERQLGSDESVELAASVDVEDDERFLVSWREELLARTWQALADLETTSGSPHYSVLRLRASAPTLSSEALASRYSKTLGKTINAGSARVMVHRARHQFAKLLIDVIAESLDDPTRANVEAELIEVRLIDYCREALDMYDMRAESDV